LYKEQVELEDHELNIKRSSYFAPAWMWLLFGPVCSHSCLSCLRTL